MAKCADCGTTTDVREGLCGGCREFFTAATAWAEVDEYAENGDTDES